MNILIVYGTLEGHTEKIAERMADMVRNKGHRVTTYIGEKIPTNYSADGFDAAIVGGSIHTGKYPACVNKFVMTHSGWLKTVPSAFFTVCLGVLSIRVELREEASRYGKDFVARIGWQPKLLETFAGAVKYSKYNFITRLIMRLVVKREGGSTDISRDHEYTDWEEVERFIESFIEETANITG